MTTASTPGLTTRLAAAAAMAVALVAPSAAQKPKAEKAPAPDIVWPLPPEKPRIKWVGVLSSVNDVEPPKKRGWLKKMINEETSTFVYGLERPMSVAVDSKDRVYVTDAHKSTVFSFDFTSKKLEVIGAGGRGRLVTPFGVAVDKDDRVFVSDTTLKVVNVYAPGGELLASLNRIGGETMKNPTGLCVDAATNRLLVADSNGHRLFAVDLKTLTTGVSFAGDAESGEFFYPSAVASDAAGNIYVADTLNFCVKVFDKDFKFIRKIGEHGTSLGQFDRPKGIAVDSERNIYVVDSAFSNFQIFNPQGQLLLFVGDFGIQPGEFRLPTSVFIDKRDQIYVVDSINARVQKFQFLGGN